MATSVNVSATNNADIDGLLAGTKWSGTISYSFPTSSGTYANPYSGGDGEPTTSGFSAAPTQMQAAINYAIALIQSYTNASIAYNGTGSADIMIAQSPAANPTSYAYYPGNYAAGGDVWFGTQYDYTQAQLGNYYFTTALHELGHALGLKHSQETGGVANVAVPSAHDDSEYTVMSYRSYVGGPLTGYTNEAYGYPQTYMANDILALQTLYGANYTTQSGNTIYTWSPTTGQEFINGVGQLAPGGGVGGSANRIYDTVWDGNGVDTYDLSNYATNLTINLNPGAPSVFSTTQLAYLGNGHYAAGNVYNAYLYNGDARSYIDNATGGSGNDTIIGNAIANVLKGGGGNDTITGGGGNDTIDGGPGTDTAVYSGNEANYLIAYNRSTQTFTIADERSGSPDGTDTVTGIENFQFADGTISSSALTSPPVVIEALGATSLVQVGTNYYLEPVGSNSGPVLKFGGAALTAGQFGSYWSILGAEAVSGGYDVAWKNTATGLYNVWSVDSSGNYVTDLLASASPNSGPLESFETIFHQDLNSDGTIGLVGTTIEALGATSLVQIGANYYLEPVGSNSGPVLKFGGAALTAGQFGSYWSILGAEAVSGGYDVAWKNTATGLYNVWSVDSSGNYVTDLLASASPNSGSVESFETIFHQDLNSDGTIGLVGTTIEALGATSQVQVGTNYYLEPVGSNSGPVLKFGGAALTAGQFGSYWSILGAEAVSGGYDVAWKNTATGLYNIWSVDSSGNYVTDLLASASPNSGPLESFETIFHQDLNGDGTIGLLGTTIEALGATSLVQIGANYYLEPVGSNSGLVLKFGGAALTAGQFGSYWSILGAEAVSGGYDVAWKNTTTGLYNIWSVDSSGNYVTDLLVSAAPNSGSLESFETSFHQDLNGDGTTGPISMSNTAVAHSQLLDQQNDFRFVDNLNAGAFAATPPSQSGSSPFDHVAHDSFVVTARPDQIGFHLEDSSVALQFNKEAGVRHVLAITHHDASVIEAPDDALVLQHFSIAQLMLAHQGNFHFV